MNPQADPFLFLLSFSENLKFLQNNRRNHTQTTSFLHEFQKIASSESVSVFWNKKIQWEHVESLFRTHATNLGEKSLSLNRFFPPLTCLQVYHRLISALRIS